MMTLSGCLSAQGDPKECFPPCCWPNFHFDVQNSYRLCSSPPLVGLRGFSVFMAHVQIKPCWISSEVWVLRCLATQISPGDQPRRAQVQTLAVREKRERVQRGQQAKKGAKVPMKQLSTGWTLVEKCYRSFAANRDTIGIRAWKWRERERERVRDRKKNQRKRNRDRFEYMGIFRIFMEKSPNFHNGNIYW